ncbi:hypothetical protein [Mucilaginibacter lappiensis]|uniref:Uncharacterized protein n=1 Tax=Mucilaginibacter lappiensis TaxID=354630 RepID=A0A1N6SC11_9SPHI|nr:hypothetical protein [Mucilaginibacter lappiensis]MBB6108423.1 hypothetical protein [Mucilaginibacter lappiensis]MBB6130038.1 hypothetical protein [Mucilaginibacter lappiensis]SIQ38492.1 hypothetical protein SAMN05421821_102339 [Mucilaginibacter lappiensis]
MDVSIKNITDLQEEIARIRIIEAQQGQELGKRFNSPSAIFASIMSLINSGNRKDGDDHPGIFNQDFFGLLSRIVLPVTLNKTLFKRSNFLVKTLVGLVSQKASNYISSDAIHGLWDKVKSAVHSAISSKAETPRKGGMPNVPPPVVM